MVERWYSVLVILQRMHEQYRNLPCSDEQESRSARLAGVIGRQLILGVGSLSIIATILAGCAPTAGQPPSWMILCPIRRLGPHQSGGYFA